MIRTVLVTGATGTLGRKVVGAATAAGHQVRALSRRDHVGYTGVHWYQGDLHTGAGVPTAVEGAEVILHCATQATGGKDVTSTEQLLAAARRAGVRHVVYISIVGVDRIPLPYYKTKLRVEERLAASEVGHTILRTTQFHDLIAAMFSAQRFSPLLCALRGMDFQPIDTHDVADQLVELAGDEPVGRVADVGGPEVRNHADLARTFRASRGSKRPVVTIPVPGRIATAYRAGCHLAPGNPTGRITFDEYLAEKRDSGR